MSREFRIGDRVRRINSIWNGMIVGNIGTITEISDTSNFNLREYPGMYHDSHMFELVERNTMRDFRVGDRVRFSDTSGMNDDTNIYTIHRINESLSPTFIYYDENHPQRNNYPNNFELVERVLSLETLIKRVNLGNRALAELNEDHEDHYEITNGVLTATR